MRRRKTNSRTETKFFKEQVYRFSSRALDGFMNKILFQSKMKKQIENGCEIFFLNLI